MFKKFTQWYFVTTVVLLTIPLCIAAFTVEQEKLTARRLNFLVSPKQKKFDAAPFSFHLQARLVRHFHKDVMFVIIATSSEDASEKITSILKAKKALIGNI